MNAIEIFCSIFILLLLVFTFGCGPKKTAPMPYVKYSEDIPRSCLLQCGQGNMVTGFVVDGGKLVCECENPPKKAQPRLRKTRQKKKGKK